MKVQNILETIGNTPHVRLKRLFPNLRVWLKLESHNPGASIKDRIALAMIEKAEENGELRPGGTIIEPTSGNTGVGLAMAGAVKGYRVILVMPDSMSKERITLFRVFGAEPELTPGDKGMKASIEKAREIAGSIPGSYMPMQFENIANPSVHSQTTAREIIEDFPGGADYLFAGIGTGGHITGAGGELKKNFPQMKIFGVEPLDSPVLSGGKPSPHPLQGMGAGFVPGILDIQIADHIVTVSKEDSFEMTQMLARKEGIPSGISTGAVLAAIKKKESTLPLQSLVITFAYDTGERYLSVEGLWD